MSILQLGFPIFLGSTKVSLPRYRCQTVLFTKNTFKDSPSGTIEALTSISAGSMCRAALRRYLGDPPLHHLPPPHRWGAQDLPQSKSNPTRKQVNLHCATEAWRADAAAFASGSRRTGGGPFSLKPGDHVIANIDVYSGAVHVLKIFMPRGPKSLRADLTCIENLHAAPSPTPARYGQSLHQPTTEYYRPGLVSSQCAKPLGIRYSYWRSSSLHRLCKTVARSRHGHAQHLPKSSQGHGGPGSVAAWITREKTRMAGNDRRFLFNT